MDASSNTAFSNDNSTNCHPSEMLNPWPRSCIYGTVRCLRKLVVYLPDLITIALTAASPRSRHPKGQTSSQSTITKALYFLLFPLFPLFPPFSRGGGSMPARSTRPVSQPAHESPLECPPPLRSENPNGVSSFSPLPVRKHLARFKEGLPWAQAQIHPSLSSAARRATRASPVLGCNARTRFESFSPRTNLNCDYVLRIRDNPE
ncbi:MAG: hypothetical protein JWQ04_1803 [Pedosphaera sp.]|nr:hypothetical protein [Pedosphaera sp.]